MSVIHLAQVNDFSLQHKAQTTTKGHPASYSIGNDELRPSVMRSLVGAAIPPNPHMLCKRHWDICIWVAQFILFQMTWSQWTGKDVYTAVHLSENYSRTSPKKQKKHTKITIAMPGPYFEPKTSPVQSRCTTHFNHNIWYVMCTNRLQNDINMTN